MKKHKLFTPLIILVLVVGVFAASGMLTVKAQASSPWFWDRIVEFFHNYFGYPNPSGTPGGNGGPTGVGTTGGGQGGTNSPACTVASITKGSQGFKGTVLPLLSFKWNSDGSSDLYEGGTCLTCHPPTNAPGAGKYKILGHWVPNQQFIIFVAETTESHVPFSKNIQQHHEEVQNGYWGNLWAMTPDGNNWYQLTHYSQATDGKLYGVLAPIASNNKVVWAKLVGRPTTSAPEAVWKLFQADLVVNGGVPSLTNTQNITPPNTNLVEPQNFTPDQSKFLVNMNTNTPQYGWDTYEYTVATGTSINLNNTPDQWDEHGRISPDGKKIIWATSLPYPPPPFNVPYTEYLNNYLKMEFWIMNLDGSGKAQLTHFNQPGYPEYSGIKQVANVPVWSADGTQALAGTVPGGLWLIHFQGACGKQ